MTSFRIATAAILAAWALALTATGGAISQKEINPAGILAAETGTGSSIALDDSGWG